MPSLIYPDFEAYSNSIKGIDGEMRIAGRGDGAWSLNMLDLDGVILLHGRDGAPVLYRGAPHAGRFGVYLSLPGSQTALDGQRVGEDSFTWLAPQVEVHGFSQVPARFLGIDFAEHVLLDQVAQVERLQVAWLYRTGTITATAPRVERIGALVQRAFDVHEGDPDAFQRPGARAAFVSQLAAAVLQCHLLAGHGQASPRRGRPPLSRREIVRRGIEHIQRSLRGEAAFADIPSAVGASQRSLNRAFDDLFGMAPHQFYLVERLHAIRAALRSAAPGDTVTGICSRFGVWDLGRMAAQYARMFDVLPAQELSRALAGKSAAAVVGTVRRR
ncbi:helix-turn-helix domain-containing protein [Stenotrophomonas sp. 22385]|jgi:AraC family ethanolamine operon transcriptional activator|uniref:AraC family transcriptional regulator n=1 Tax=Stenotrophomonas sp. 22385 TaxID=3453915 RepID=UPI003F829CD1